MTAYAARSSRSHSLTIARRGAMLRAQQTPGQIVMPKGLIFLLVMIAVIIVYTIAKIVSYNRLSEQQWEQVDKSKLKEWDDDEWE